MRIAFYIIGGILFLVALYFGFIGYIISSVGAQSATEHGGMAGLETAFTAGAFAVDAQLTILATIGGGIFVGAAEIVGLLQRIAVNRNVDL